MSFFEITIPLRLDASEANRLGVKRDLGLDVRDSKDGSGVLTLHYRVRRPRHAADDRERSTTRYVPARLWPGIKERTLAAALTASVTMLEVVE